MATKLIMKQALLKKIHSNAIKKSQKSGKKTFF